MENYFKLSAFKFFKSLVIGLQSRGDRLKFWRQSFFFFVEMLLRNTDAFAAHIKQIQIFKFEYNNFFRTEIE